MPNHRPTQHALDAEDSAAISSIFLRLIIFLVGRLRRPRPSAGTPQRACGAYANRSALEFQIMKNSIIIAIILAITIYGCKQNSISTPMAVTSATPPIFTSQPLSTATKTPTLNFPLSITKPKATKQRVTETPWPTLIYLITVTPDSHSSPTPPPTITAPPSRNPPLVLPEGLGLEEYKITKKDIYTIESPVISRHENRGGWYYWPNGGMLDGKLFQALDKDPGIYATLDDKKIFVVDCKPNPTRNVITAWTYGKHWIIQSACNEEFDVLWDGISLNTSKSHQSSFAFQVLGQYPFYLFKRDNKVWLSYNEKEVLLGYDEVNLTYCCESYPPPQHYENLITFLATKNEQLFYVAIGLFEK